MNSPSPTTYQPTSIVELGATRTGVIQLRREWPTTDPKAVVVISHGISEHSGRYEHVGQYLTEHGFGVVAFDHRGFGQSGGRRGWIASFEDYLDDLEDHLAEARRVGVPVILLGHSLGGLMVAKYAESQRPRPDLFVVSGPPIASAAPNPALDPLPGLVAPLFGGLRVSSGLPTSLLSRDQAVCEAYDADPLVDTKSTLDLIAAFVEAVEDTRANLDRIRTPMLAMAGEDDVWVPPASTRLLEGRPGVDVIFYPEHRHEIFNELDWQHVLDDMIAWIERNLSG